MLLLIIGCHENPSESESEHNYVRVDQYEGYGTGGGQPNLTLPFLSGEYWVLTQAYGSNDSDYAGSHKDWGFTYGNDTYALDFTQAACDAYAKPVTPMAAGTVLQVGTDGGSHDQGYGNNVLVDHGNGFVSRYAHLSQVLVSEGEWLEDTDTLGDVGNTGYVNGEACDDYGGTHLHIALYYDEEAIKPEPLSGNTDLDTWCWYNREGGKDCGGDPGNYTPVEEEGSSEPAEDSETNTGGDDESTEDSYDNYDDDGSNEIEGEGELSVAFLDISPEDGTADETEYIWVATVVSPDAEPDATLYIRNPNDGVTYDFTMETESDESPYVFTYRKTLNDPTTYTYYVKATNGDGNDKSNTESVQVGEGDGDEPELGTFYRSPTDGDAGDTVFSWGTEVWSDDEPEVWLKIVNPNDATIYSFEMDVEENGDAWYASYDKSLNDATVYTYWMEAENKSTWNSGEVLSVETE